MENLTHKGQVLIELILALSFLLSFYLLTINSQSFFKSNQLNQRFYNKKVEKLNNFQKGIK